MYRVKIFGAGSIGNHLAHASRQLGWEVFISDIDETALTRMRNEIYPQRYGRWDSTIQLHTNSEAPKGIFDFIFVGTPPDSHVLLAIQSIAENPKGILIEKPLCCPDLNQAEELFKKSSDCSCRFFIGYDHVVGSPTIKAEELIRSGRIGDIITIDVSFREHWEGIFNAHSWLDGPADTYLGYWKKGGGALGEHSHALNLWQHFAHIANKGRVLKVSARLHYIRNEQVEYDDMAILNLETESGLFGRVVQDVVSRPHRKKALIQGSRGALEWILGYSSEGDALILKQPGEADEIFSFSKTRPDDFFQELKHLHEQIEGSTDASPIDLRRGLNTMMVVAAAHKSECTGRRVSIDYDKGYSIDALSA